MLDDTRRGECGAEPSPSRAPRQQARSEARHLWGSNFSSRPALEFLPSSNTSLHRAPAARRRRLFLSSLHRGAKPAPVSSKSLGGAAQPQSHRSHGRYCGPGSRIAGTRSKLEVAIAVVGFPSSASRLMRSSR